MALIAPNVVQDIVGAVAANSALVVVTPGTLDTGDRFQIVAKAGYKVYKSNGTTELTNVTPGTTDTITQGEGATGVRFKSDGTQGVGNTMFPFDAYSFLAATGPGVRSAATTPREAVTCAAPVFDPTALTGGNSVLCGAGATPLVFVPDASGTTTHLDCTANADLTNNQFRDSNGDPAGAGTVTSAGLATDGYRVEPDGTFHGNTSVKFVGASDNSGPPGTDYGPETTVSITVKYTAPAWSNGGSMNATVGTATAIGTITRDAADASDPATYVNLARDPSEEIRDGAGVLVPTGYVLISAYTNLLTASTVKCHAKGSPTIVAYLAKDGSGTAASTGATLTITASIATTTALPTDATRVAVWDFRALVVGHAFGGSAVPGAVQVLHDSTVVDGVTTHDYIPKVGASDTTHAFYAVTNHLILIGTGIHRGLTIRGYQNSTPYAGGTSVGGLNLVGVREAKSDNYGGLALDPQDSWAMVTFSHTIRGRDLSGVETDPCAVWDLNGKFTIVIGADNLISVTSTSGGGATTFYAHAGKNFVFVRSRAANAKIDVYHGTAGVSAATVTALGGATASGVLCAMNKAAGNFPCYSILHVAAVGNDGDIADGVVALYKAWFVAENTAVPHTKFVAVLSNSESQGFWDQPGMSRSGRLAILNPDTCYWNGSRSGLGIDEYRDTTLPRALIAQAALGYSKNVFIIGDPINNFIGASMTAAQAAAVVSTMSDTIRAAVPTAKIVAYNIALLTATPSGTAGVGGVDAAGVNGGVDGDANNAASAVTVTNRETLVRNYKTALDALLGSKVDYVVNWRAPFTTLTGIGSPTASQIRNAAAGLDANALNLYAAPYAPDATAAGAGPSATGTLIVAALPTTSCDAIHKGFNAQAGDTATIDTTVNAALAASGASTSLHGDRLGRSNRMNRGRST